MPKTVTIHQPNYLPWIGLFQKAAKADTFVVLDHVGFSKSGVTHRNKIRTKEGWTYLTIPIQNKYDGLLINEVKLPEDRKWWGSHYNQIVGNYGKADHYNEYSDFLKKTYVEGKAEYENLRDLNVDIILYLLDRFDIHPEIIYSKDLSVPKEWDKTDLNLGITKMVGGTRYISGKSGKEYLEENKFKDAGVELEYYDFTPFEYKQRWEGF